MDKLRKTRRHHSKERLNISSIPKFDSDTSKALKGGGQYSGFHDRVHWKRAKINTQNIPGPQNGDSSRVTLPRYVRE